MTEVHDCGAAWNGRYGAFECGYPLHDGCFAGYEDEAGAYEDAEIDAWKALVDEGFDWNRPGHRPMTQEEALILDEWEFEVHGEEPVKGDPYDADGNPIHVGCDCPEAVAEDIPF